jgi:type IV pilus assembly protein PilA
MVAIMTILLKDFKLVVLIIVIAIIGILATIVIPAHQDFVIRTKVSDCQSIAVSANEGFVHLASVSSIQVEMCALQAD